MTFLFDIGKVLLDFEFEPSLRKLIPADDPEIESRLAAVLSQKDNFEAGRLSLAAYLPEALGLLGNGISEEAFLHSWRDIFTPNLPMWEAVRNLEKDRHRLILFSNTNPIHIPWIFDEYPIFRSFEGGVYSYETGHIKPEREIYHLAIERHRLIPGETRYIDDLPANIRTGQSLGFRCHQYDLGDHSSFERWLESELAPA